MLLLSIFLTLLPTTFCQFCKDPPIYKTTLGNANLTILTDGPLMFSDNPFVTLPYAAVKRSYHALYRTTDPIVVQQNILLFDTATHRILFDTGAFKTPQLGQLSARAGKLSRNLELAKISPESIDAVIITHAHADHFAGLIDNSGHAAFPNAKVYIGRIEHEFWSSDPIPNVPTGVTREKLQGLADGYLPSIAPYEKFGRLVLTEDGDTPLPAVRFLLMPGHTPGHMAVQLSDNGETMLVIGDAWISRADQVQHPEWQFAPETDAVAAYNSRIGLLERAVGSKERVLAYHEEFPGLGFVQKIGQAFDWIPEVKFAVK